MFVIGKHLAERASIADRYAQRHLMKSTQSRRFNYLYSVKRSHLETFLKIEPQNGCTFQKIEYNNECGHHKSSGERLMTQTKWWCGQTPPKVKPNTPPMHLAIWIYRHLSRFRTDLPHPNGARCFRFISGQKVDKGVDNFPPKGGQTWQL